MQDEKLIVDLDGLARKLGLSKAWLKAEAVAGRIPSLKAGHQRIFNLDAVTQAIAKQAATATGVDNG